MVMVVANVYDLEGTTVEKIDLPAVFSEKLRGETVKRAVLAQQSSLRQRYGADPLAGKRSSAHYEGKRHRRFTMMNREMARMPRIHGKGVMPALSFTARIVPHATKGRKAHPPKASKIFEKKINKKERRAAIKSALAASANIKIVQKRHKTKESPIIILDDFESLSHTKDVRRTLEKIVGDEIKRCEKRKIRAGRGKTRGRRYRKKHGPLIITASTCPLLKASRNISGVDATTVNNLNAELLAPGAHPGRLTVISKKALETIKKKFGDTGDRKK